MKKIILTLSVLLAMSSSQAQNDTASWLFKRPGHILQDNLNKIKHGPYLRCLESAILSIEETGTLADSALFLAIPRTESEYVVYFSCDYEEGKVGEAWIKLDNMINAKATDNDTFFLSYLGMSEFVDGYYAEAYFSYLEFMIEKHHGKLFCSSYPNLSQECLRRLSDYYEEYCE